MVLKQPVFVFIFLALNLSIVVRLPHKDDNFFATSSRFFETKTIKFHLIIFPLERIETLQSKTVQQLHKYTMLRSWISWNF